MGLNTTHDCWNGPYSAFARFRDAIAKAAGYPPLYFMEGYWEPSGTMVISDDRFQRALEQLPISWDIFRRDPLSILLAHSDCDGFIYSYQCGPLADRLDEVAPEIKDDDIRRDVENFSVGLRVAAELGEDVEFA